MAIIVTAPEPFDGPGTRVYLGGAIDMGRAAPWQDEVIAALGAQPDLVILNPRRSAFTADTLDEQILWELNALEQSDLILMWFPRESAAPVALFETGLYLKSDRLILGAEIGFYRRRNLELTCARYGVRLWASLDDLIAQVKLRTSDASG